MSAAKVAVAEKRVKSCRSPTSGQRRYSPTGRRSPTAALNGHAESPPHKTNGLLVDRQPAAPPVPAVNGFPVTRDAPAATRPSRVADNGHSPTAAVQQRKAASAKGHHPPHHKATQLKSSSQPAANQRSAQQHNNNNNNKVQHPAKQRNGGGPTGVEDMVVVSALRRQQMKDAFQPWVMQVDALFMSPPPPPPAPCPLLLVQRPAPSVPFIVSHRCQPNLLGHTHRPPSLGVGRNQQTGSRWRGSRRCGCARRGPFRRCVRNATDEPRPFVPLVAPSQSGHCQ